jgi:amino acid transporter
MGKSISRDSRTATAIGLPGVLSFCLAGAAPIVAMFFNVPTLASQARAATPLVFLLSAIGLIAPGVPIVSFSRRLSSAGGFYTWISHLCTPWHQLVWLAGEHRSHLFYHRLPADQSGSSALCAPSREVPLAPAYAGSSSQYAGATHPAGLLCAAADSWDWQLFHGSGFLPDPFPAHYSASLRLAVAGSRVVLCAI